MNEWWSGVGQVAGLVLALGLSTPLLGRYLAHVYGSPKHWRIEAATYRALRLDPDADQHWRNYALSVLGFSFVGVLVLYVLARVQGHLPFDLGMAGLPSVGAWNTAVSFVTNTNWQWYSGEQAAGQLFQMSGLAVQNFASAAVGMAVAVALVRGLARSRSGGRVGNFWTDLVRTCLRVLLPLAFVSALLLVLAGAVQSLASPQDVHTLVGSVQHIPGGPVASQEAIKELGTNGGGYFNANSAHPFENPTPFTNLLEVFLLLLIPFAMTWMFGLMVGSRKQGVAVGAVMAVLLLGMIAGISWAEAAHHGTAPTLAGAAMEGKEVRFGVPGSALFAAATTGTSTGAVNATHDSFTSAGGGLAMANMMLGEIAPGGVGSGLYGLLMLAILTVFLCGLMVGRTPEYLGKKVGRGEITLVAAYVLVVPATILVTGALAIALPAGRAALLNTGPHGLSEALYAVTSATNNNGSAFAGLGAGTVFWNAATGVDMLLGRFIPIVLVLALAGRFSAQRTAPPSAGTLPTDSGLFVGLLTGVAVVVVGLTFVPVLALGPIAEALL